jgi:antitoxin HicB
MIRYLGIFTPAEEGGFVVRVPDVPGVITQGETLAEAKENAVDALELMLSDVIENGKKLPAVSTKRAKHGQWIQVSALAQLKISLYEEFTRARITKTQLASRMGIAKQVVDRLFDLQMSTRIEQIEAAFAALGKTITITIQDAA